MITLNKHKYKILFFWVALFVGFVIGHCSRRQPDTITKIEYKIDTLRIVSPAESRVDTFFREVLVPIKQKAETIVQTDSVFLTRVDSVKVYLPFERKVYEDSTYRAVISGYKPTLEEIDVYARETTIYKEKAPSRFSPYVSGSIGLDGDFSLGGGVFFRDNNALGVEWGNRGLQVKYIHKF